VSRYYIDPFGCVKNQVDAENLMAYLNSAGWECAADAGSSDLIIVNSCGFIESAKQESIDAVLQWRGLYPGKKILLAGCLAQRYMKELPEILTEADAFFGVKNPAEIIKKVNSIFPAPDKEHESSSIILNSVADSKTSINSYHLLPGERPLLSLPGSAYVKISEGCDNRCSYCAIPLIRGGLVSRDISAIVEECRSLLARGVKELCVIGQDIGAFGADKHSGETNQGLPGLLGAISSLKGDFWVRLLYIHPDHFQPEILDLMEKDTRFLPYFDIPFQHASPKILAAMNRCRSQESPAEKYLALINTIRARLPDAVIRSTFLLGFPGETEEDFAMLLDFQEKANLDWLGCFLYSREENTKSYLMKKRIPAKTASSRKKIIEERQIPITEKNMRRFTGRDMDVLLEEKIGSDAANTGEANESFWLGRSFCQAPDIDGATVIVCDNESGKNLRAGEFIKCRITARRGFDLEAVKKTAACQVN